MILRRFWIMAAVFVVGVVVTIVFVLDMERVYETTAVIEFDTPAVSQGENAAGGDRTSIPRQLQLIEQRMMSRENLIEVIERYSVFADAEDLSVVEQVVALREAITFQQVTAVQSGTLGSDGRLSAMLVTVRLDDPLLAAELANEFARGIVEDTYRSVARRTSEAVRLLSQQEARVAAESREIEAEISTFQVSNQGALPEGQEFRRDEFQRLQESLMDIERTMQELERERRVFETFGIQSIVGGSDLAATASGPAASIEAELRSLEVELERARQVLAPSNPEISQLEARVEVLTTRAEALRAETRDRFMADINSQLDLLEQQRQIISERLEELEVAMMAAPSVEVELAALNLELTRVQERYAVAANRLAEAENAQLLLEAQQSESMRLLEPALVPEYPVGPSRTRNALLGMGVAGFVALVVGFTLEVLNPVMRSAGAVAARTGLMPVVTIPEVRRPQTRIVRFARQLAFAAAFALFCGGVFYVAGEISQPFAEFMAQIYETGLGRLQTEDTPGA
jgi:uncharacterized protein involved in exopolysaccharide biosynthesis